jgi:CelD/BcsL family acetyltransferase involved in cellulose biosynthesis
MIEDLKGFRGLGSEWNEIAPPKDVEPWQTFSWMEAAATACGGNHLLRVITVRKDGRLVAIAPLVLKPSEQPFSPLRLDFLGGEELKEPNRLISLDPPSLELLVDVIVSERVYPIRLSRVPNDPENIRFLVTKFRESGWFIPILSMSYPYLDLGTNPIRKSLREDLGRARRKAKVHGEVRSEAVVASSREELQEYLEDAFRIEGSGWKGRNGTAILSNEFRRKFFERYACSAWNDGTLRLRFLRVNGACVAAQYAIESARSYWLLNVGYDEDYRQCSPGNLLLEESIRDAARSGLLRYNLLGKEEPWTRRWTTTAQDCLVLAAYRLNAHGVKAMWSDASYLVARRMKERKEKRIGRIAGSDSGAALRHRPTETGNR